MRRITNDEYWFLLCVELTAAVNLHASESDSVTSGFGARIFSERQRSVSERQIELG